MKSRRCEKYVPDEQCETHSDFAELGPREVRGKTWGQWSRGAAGDAIRTFKNTDSRYQGLRD